MSKMYFTSNERTSRMAKLIQGAFEEVSIDKYFKKEC